MKQFLLIVVLFVAACQSQPKDKLTLAKKAVITKLKESAHDWKSYEEVKWGTLDSSYTDLLDDSAYIEANKIFNEALEESEKQNEKAKIWVSSYSYGNNRFREYLNEAKRYQDVAQIALDSMKKMRERFVSIFNGYTLAHSYRSKNASGNKTISHDLYYLDTTFKITKIEDISTDYYDNKRRKSKD